MSSHKHIDDAAERAIKKHQQLLHAKTLELLLGNMVAMDGVHEVRQKLKWYYDHLDEFVNEL